MVQNEPVGLSSAPYTNRGVLCTLGTELRTFLLFDWIQVTIKPFYDYDIEESADDYLYYKKYNSYKKVKRVNDYNDLFYHLFGVPRTNILFSNDKMYCYEFCYSFKNIKIYGSDSHPEFGVHILLSGTACRELEDLGISYASLFKKLKEFKPHYTRIDVSFDDYTGKYWTLDRVANCIKNIEVVTRFRSSLQIKKEDLISLDNIGHTIQFGSRTSDIQFTFYDKLKERKSNNYLVDDKIKHWNRFEIRFRNEKAENVINNYLYFNDNTEISDLYTHIELNNFNEYILSIVNNYISFRVKSFTDKNRRRWLYQSWWQDFIGELPKIKFQSKPIEYSITKKRKWLERSVSYSNFCVMLADVPDLTVDTVVSKYLYDLFMQGSDKFEEKDLQFVNEYRIKNNLIPLKLEDVKSYVNDVREILVKK